MAVDLDEFDLHIVDILLRDGRLPASQIAEMVGLSRPAVVERIDKLESNGVIRGTTIIVDPATLGRTVAAFASVCIVWGTTYLFIRIAVETIPPLLLTSVRYLRAGVILLAIATLRGDRLPRDRRVLGEIVVVGVLLVGIGNLSVVWAEQWVPSGIAALLV